MCDALAAELPGLKVIHRENGGLAAARNTGLKAATGDWLLFLDSDDAMAPGLLAQLRGALAATRTATGSSASISNGSLTAR